MKLHAFASHALMLGALSCIPAIACAETVFTPLRGFDEVPSVSSTASGSFAATIDTAAGTIAYELTYTGLQGEIRQSHIHFGQRSVNGGISVFLCQTAANPDPTGLAPTCPQSPGTVSGTLRAANIIGPAGQGIAATEFAELIAAIRGGVAYVNVHTVPFPSGEIRGQARSLSNLRSAQSN